MLKGKQCFKTAASIKKYSQACDQTHLCSAEWLNTAGVTQEGIPPLMVIRRAVPERVWTAAARQREFCDTSVAAELPLQS